MKTTIPITERTYYSIMENQDFLITCEKISAFHIPRFRELPEFDLYMDQVIGLADKYLSVLSVDGKGLLTPSMINNYVKSGVLPPPKNKKYNRTHLAILILICITKPVMELSAISEIIHRGLETDTVENLLDGFAMRFETELTDAARHAEHELEHAENEEILSFVAIESMMKANAARIVAMYAYHATKNPEPIEDNKSEKKTEKKKAKKENDASENSETNE